MKVFVFDLLPYDENLAHLQVGKELPYPLSKQYFKPDVAVRTYAEHLDAWQLLDELGYDGVGFNEHHSSPYGLMNSPNLMAASAAQRTKNIKLLIYGNLLPLHEPLRLAEELAMLDCLSNGRLISGFARGIPREYNVHNVKHAESRARFEEAYEIIMKAWTEDVFSYEGKFWSYHDVAIWPRPVQQPAPPVWTPITSSKESIEWAGAHNIPITPGLGSRGMREDIIRYYAQCLANNGHQITPGHLTISMEAYVADSKEQAVREYGPHHLYFNRVLFSHGNTTELALNTKTGYLSDQSASFMRPENLAAAARSRSDYRDMTMADVERKAETLPWGTAAEVRDRIIEEARHAGAGTVQVSFNRGVMPHEMFVAQIRRFAEDVLPALQACDIDAVPLAAGAVA
ncbi:MAG TPA: LLM class flavin-dependent oxidoreductase [Candidatus Lustribacter sp.]|jgi:alkanesulfonate monooxygenase SsuD/methylene tetrahydromethanopterin reductase-like flavin-dependent oxidoreductase (luciferase family)|nr:LLM class flavin-dependent oxidoreductase [Candidatus Lustribacter sp.]